MKVKQPFETVVSEHGPTVLRVCHVIVGPAGADDAWSEKFLAAMKAYPDLPDEANVEAWLVTIAHNKAIDMVRVRSRRATADGIASLRKTLRDSPAAPSTSGNGDPS